MGETRAQWLRWGAIALTATVLFAVLPLGRLGVPWGGQFYSGSFYAGAAAIAVGQSAFPAQRALSTPGRTILTQELLDERIAHPIREGRSAVIDLRDLTIDLESDSAELTPDVFYSRLQLALNGRSATDPPPGLDLSHSLIKGEVDLSLLGRRIPAYSGLSLPALDTFNKAFSPLAIQDLESASRMLTGSFYDRAELRSPTGALARSFLLQAQPAQLDTFVFQGPLTLNETCFMGPVTASKTTFLGPVEAAGAIFSQPFDAHSIRFAQLADFSQAEFQSSSSFRNALFAGPSRFNQSTFAGSATWQGATFHESAGFARASFRAATFNRAHWQANADFDQAQFSGPASFQKARFDQSVFLTDALLNEAVSFRQAQFQQSISLRGGHVLNLLDFGDVRFSQASTINVADLDFSAGENARILGSPGQLGKRFSVPALSTNETVLRNLVRNFRLLEQIGDANQLEYTAEQLRLAQLQRQLFGLSLNQASALQLVRLGMSQPQAEAVVARAKYQPFVSPAELLAMDEIDLTTYIKVRDHITTQPNSVLNRAGRLLRLLMLGCLLLLSSYGTNVGLVFSIGLVAMTLFAIMFWLVDRYRRRTPTPIVPKREEWIAVGTTGAILLLLALVLLLQSSEQPLSALATVGLIVGPVPAVLIWQLYRRGRFHALMDSSYFLENGALRRLQVLIARLPIIPRYPFYRERYKPLLSDRRWNWLNYYGFSLNNWFKFGFSDIRLRDQAVPGLISALVWYQWSLGIAYIALLLWTLSRTIPGLNLLLYF